MNAHECTWEEEVVTAVRAGQWPEHCAPELREHVTECAGCADMAAVAAALFDDASVALRDVHVPAPGAVWWRAQRRARAEAVRAASRAMTVVQVVSVVSAVVLAVVLFGMPAMPEIDWMMLMPHWTLPLILAAAACVALAPVVVYLAFARD